MQDELDLGLPLAGDLEALDALPPLPSGLPLRRLRLVTRRPRPARERHADCVVCGQSFPTRRAHARYCGSACRSAAYRRRVSAREQRGAGRSTA